MMRILQLCFLLAITSVSHTDASIAKDKVESDYSEYLTPEYIADTISGIRAVISRRNKEGDYSLSIDEVIDMAGGPILDEIGRLLKRTKNITAAVLKQDGASGALGSCDYAMLSVSLLGIKKSLLVLNNCKDNKCSPKEITTNTDMMTFEYIKIQNLLENCPYSN